MKPYYEIKPYIFIDYILKEDFSGIIEADEIKCFVNPKTEEEKKECEYYLNIKTVDNAKFEEGDYSNPASTLYKNKKGIVSEYEKCVFDSRIEKNVIDKLNKKTDKFILRFENNVQMIYLYNDLDKLYDSTITQYKYYCNGIYNMYKMDGAFIIDLRYLTKVKEYIENPSRYNYKLHMFKTKELKNASINYVIKNKIEDAVIIKDGYYNFYNGNYEYSYFYSNIEKDDLNRMFNWCDIKINEKNVIPRHEFIEVSCIYNFQKKYIYKDLGNARYLIREEDEKEYYCINQEKENITVPKNKKIKLHKIKLDKYNFELFNMYNIHIDIIDNKEKAIIIDNINKDNNYKIYKDGDCYYFYSDLEKYELQKIFKYGTFEININSERTFEFEEVEYLPIDELNKYIYNKFVDTCLILKEDKDEVIKIINNKKECINDPVLKGMDKSVKTQEDWIKL